MGNRFQFCFRIEDETKLETYGQHDWPKPKCFHSNLFLIVNLEKFAINTRELQFGVVTLDLKYGTIIILTSLPLIPEIVMLIERVTVANIEEQPTFNYHSALSGRQAPKNRQTVCRP
jgi:hypothetical protein